MALKDGRRVHVEYTLDDTELGDHEELTELEPDSLERTCGAVERLLHDTRGPWRFDA